MSHLHINMYLMAVLQSLKEFNICSITSLEYIIIVFIHIIIECQAFEINICVLSWQNH